MLREVKELSTVELFERWQRYYLVLQPHLWFASLVVCASRSGLVASAPA
jgi:hypothetical protein